MPASDYCDLCKLCVMFCESDVLFRVLTSFLCNYTGARIPRSGNSAEKFQAKWTLTNEGQKKYGGWKDEAYDKYNQCLQLVKDWREADVNNGKKFDNYCLKAVREIHGIPDSEKEPGQKGRKRKAKDVPVALPVKKKASTVIDDSDFEDSASEVEEEGDATEE